MIKKVFKTKWFSVEAITGAPFGNLPYYRLSCNDSVCILAKTEDGKIILTKQYRPAIGAFSLELPSGYIDKGESPETAVIRELKEETGFVCDSISYLGALNIVPNKKGGMIS